MVMMKGALIVVGVFFFKLSNKHLGFTFDWRSARVELIVVRRRIKLSVDLIVRLIVVGERFCRIMLIVGTRGNCNHTHLIQFEGFVIEREEHETHTHKMRKSKVERPRERERERM